MATFLVAKMRSEIEIFILTGVGYFDMAQLGKKVAA